MSGYTKSQIKNWDCVEWDVLMGELAVTAQLAYWVSFSVPAQVSQALSSRLIAPTGEVQATVPAAISGLVVSQLDGDCPDWYIALKCAKPWRVKAREGDIYRQRMVRDPRSEDRSRF